MDTWALGVILYEMLVGITPFHCYEMRELVRKINDGRYKVSVDGEDVKLEICLFLLECLQTHEDERIQVTELLYHPLISEEFLYFALHELDRKQFQKEVGTKEYFSEDYNSSQGSAMLSRFDDTTIMDDDIILTSRRSFQRQILVKMLTKYPDLSNSGFNFAASPYF